MVFYIVTARKGSKGFPNKNRKLVPILKENMPDKVFDRLVLTTDDEEIQHMFPDTQVKVVDRPSYLAQDETSIRPVLRHAINMYNLNEDDDVVLLYPTYPERDFDDVRSVLNFYQRNDAKSLLCAQPPKKGTEAYTLIEVDDENRFRMVDEDYRGIYRRQNCDHTLTDYYPREVPENVYEYSHFISVFRVSELPNLNKNLYNEDTIIYEMDERVIDVDTKEDYESFKNSR